MCLTEGELLRERKKVEERRKEGQELEREGETGRRRPSKWRDLTCRCLTGVKVSSFSLR